MNLIILESRDRIDNDRYLVADHRAGHIRHVLHGQVGSEVEVGLVNVGAGRARIESLSADGVVLGCHDLRPPEIMSPDIDLICAVPRPKAMRRVVALAATMGLRSLHLVRACRVEKSYLQSPWLEPDRIHACLLEGLSQGKRIRLPEVHVHDLFRPFVEDEIPALWPDADGGIIRLIAEPDSPNRLHRVLTPHDQRIVLAIGPEGGWVPFELQLMTSLCFRPFALGTGILRVEAAIAATVAQIAALRALADDANEPDSETNS